MSTENLSRRTILSGMTLASVVGATAASGAGAARTEAVSDIQKLIAIEEIKKLKARYFRFVDTKQWDALQALFTPDATLWYPEAFATPRGLQESMDVNRVLLKEAISVHQGYLPEIDILSPTTAQGIWAMSDHLYLLPDNILKSSELVGAGHYHETYERRGGTWFIKTLKLTRLREVTTSMPKRID